MKQRWGTLQLYLAVVGGLGLLTITVATTAQPEFKSLPVAVIAIVLALCELFQVQLPAGQAMSVSAGVVLAALWHYGLTTTLWGLAFALILVGLYRKTRPLPVLFNIGQLTLSTLVAYWTFVLPGGTRLLFPASTWPYVASVLAYSVANGVLVVRGTSLYRHLGFWQAWLQDAPTFALLVSSSLVISLGTTWAVRAWALSGLFGAAIVVIGQHLVLKLIAFVTQERAARGLLRIASTRNLNREGHSDRVMRYAVLIAEEIGLSREEIRTIRYAALLHDIGLSMINRRIVTKQGGLAREEYKEIKRHSELGARIVARVGVLAPVAALIRHHHERVDGKGYPDGLAAEDIPLGARILTVAEAFDVLTTDGPDRPGLPVEEALAILREEAGAQFDPLVVSSFLAALCREDPCLSAALIQRLFVDLEAEIQSTTIQLREFVTRTKLQDPLWLDFGFSRHVRRGGGTAIPGQAMGLLALHDLGKVINSSLSLERVLEILVFTVYRLLEARCCLLLLDEGRSRLVARTAHGFPRQIIHGLWAECGQGNVGRAWESCRPSLGVKPEPGAANTFETFLASAGVDRLYCVPLLAKARPIGVLVVCGGAEEEFSNEQINLLAVVSSQAALAIDNAKLYTETENRLREISCIKRFTDTVLANVSTGIIVVDRECKVRLVNEAARRLCSDLGFVGDGDRCCQPEMLVEHEALIGPILHTLATGESSSNYPCVIQGPGREMALEVQVTPLPGENGIEGTIVLLRDMTERLRLEEKVRQTERLAAVGELAAGAAHEIRNPLTSIRGFIQLLEPQLKSAQTDSTCVQIILEEISRIDEIIKDLLLMAKPATPRIETCRMEQVVEDSIVLVQNEATARGVSIERDFPPDLVAIRADPRQLRQVFLNLFTNALDAMPAGGVITVCIRVEDGFIRADVKDTGIGIPAEDLKRLFDPFYTTKETGVGLGLSVCHGIIRSHGGRIEVQSSPGQGAVFSVYLPVTGNGGAGVEQ